MGVSLKVMLGLFALLIAPVISAARPLTTSTSNDAPADDNPPSSDCPKSVSDRSHHRWFKGSHSTHTSHHKSPSSTRIAPAPTTASSPSPMQSLPPTPVSVDLPTFDASPTPTPASAPSPMDSFDPAPSPAPLPTTFPPPHSPPLGPPPPASHPPPPQGVSAEVTELLRLVNQGRRENSKPPLCLNEQLNTAAYRHSRDMGVNTYFSHDSQDGRTPIQRMVQAGYPEGGNWGENIAWGQSTPLQVYTVWKNSPGHWQNILGDFEHIGIGLYKGGSYRYVWTQDFGANPSATCL